MAKSWQYHLIAIKLVPIIPLTYSEIRGDIKKYEAPMDCLFCKIAKGDIPAKITYQDDFVMVFDDINPQAPHHKLIIPKKHIATINDLNTEDNVLMGHMIQTAQQLAKQLHIADEGYRLVLNCNAGAGQTVFHIHIHLLGGRPFNWPPG